MKDRLKLLRKTLGLKQREVAERLGVNVGLIGQWESGTKAVGKARIYQLCKEYDVRREWLETGAGDMFEPTPTLDDKLAGAAAALFEELSPRAKNAVLKALQERVAIEKNQTKSKPDKPKGFDYEAQLKRFDFGDESIWKDYLGHRQ